MAGQKTILIVEDFTDSRELMALYLRRSGYTAVEAVDGIDGLEQAAAVKPDLIIMDLSMPRMDGLEATKRLKRDPLTRNIPVLVATAHTSAEMANSALQAGAAEVLLKPVDFRALGGIISRHLSADSGPASNLSEHDKDSNPATL